MRDILFTVLFAAMAGLSLRYAHLGVMLWVWSALLPPNAFLYGFGHDIPFNKISVGCTLVGLLVDARRRISIDPILGMMTLFLLQVSLSQALAPTPPGWGGELYERFVKVALAAFALRFVAIDRGRIHAIILAMCLAVATGTVAEAGKVLLSGGAHHTIGPPSWGDENSSATMILMFMPLYLLIRKYASSELARTACLIVFLMAVGAVIGSFSRGGFIGLALLVVVLFIGARRRLPMIVALVVVAGLAMSVVPDGWVERIASTKSADQDASFMGRVYQWKILTLMALDHPVMGGGILANMEPGLWTGYANRLGTELTAIDAPRPDGPRASHSIYFQVLGETGFVGLGLFLAMFGLGLRAAGRIRRAARHHPELAWAADLAGALRLGLIVYLLTGAALPIPYFEPAYLLLAALSALSTLPAEDPARRHAVPWRMPSGARSKTPRSEGMDTIRARHSAGLFAVLIGLALAVPAWGEGVKSGIVRRAPDGTLYLDEAARVPPPAVAAPAASAVPAPKPAARTPAAPAAPAPAPAVAALPPPSSPRILAVCPAGCPFTSLGAAVQAAGTGDTVVVEPGLYVQGGVIRADRVSVLAKPGAHLKGTAVEGKAALLVTGSDTVIEGLECSAIAVPDRNGACVRLEGRGLTLRRVHFHDSEQGLLASASRGEITIEDSVFERLGGAGGFAHAIYVNAVDRLTIRRSAIVSSRGEGHEVKSRARRTVIEDSLIGSFDGVDSRPLDLPNGGEVLIRASVLEKGPNSSTGEVIGFGLEGVTQDGNSLTLDGVTAIIDRRRGRLINGATVLTIRDSRVIGGESQPQTAEIWVKDRAAAGLGPYPESPATAAPPTAMASAAAPPIRRVCLGGGCDYLSLTQALREAAGGSTIVLAPGVYFEGAALRAHGVTVRAEPGAMIKGATVEGKAALVISGDDTVIEGLECGFIAVPDGNGACVRLEGRNLTLRHVVFHDSEQGVLAIDGTGAVLIEDSRFERLGNNARAHALSVGRGSSFTLRRSVVSDTRGLGHAVKSRSARTVIEHSTLASLTGAESRLIDVALGGELVVRDSLLQKGPGSDHAEAIGFGLEGLAYPVNAITLDATTIVFDRSPNRLMRSVVRGEMLGGRIVAGEEGAMARLAGFLVDRVFPGRVGSNLSFYDVRRFPTRQEAGLPPFPDLPVVP